MILTRRHLLLAASAGVPSAFLAACSRRAPTHEGPGGVGAPSPVTPSTLREVADVVPAQRTSDGAGVKLKRAIGGRLLSMLDPFLLLDEFQTDDPNDYVAGFPDHPHRGFETVTYMIHGAMEHKDSVGNQGRLRAGSAQWMTAGHGIVHSEMPKQERGLMWGYQLWVNLPRSRKMIKPRYQDIAPEQIPEFEQERAKLRVIAGRAFGRQGPVTGIDVEPTFLDLTLEPRARVFQPLPEGHNAFVYVADGALRIGDGKREVSKGQLAVLGKGNVFSAEGVEGGGRALLIAGRPLGEPVARYGPFVMNTDDEIRRAFEDYRAGRLAEGG